MKKVCLALMLMLPGIAAGAALPEMQQVEKNGIVWTFSEAVPVGQFVNGDYYVVGPVTVTSIDPPPAGGRNGSVLNLPANGKAGFDDRQDGGTYQASQVVTLPLSMMSGDMLVSTISVDTVGTLPMLWHTDEKSISPVRKAAILTCLAEQVTPDTFRPGYCDRERTLYHADALRRGLLPVLPKVEDTPDIDFWAGMFEGPWLDTVYFGFAAPVEQMPSYGREVARAVSIAGLLLCCDFTPQEKEPLLINFVQVGIDLWSILEAGGMGWRAHGGHGNGRKLPIVLSGILLGDADMQSPQATYPGVLFSEDMQTIYGNGWTGATALYGGHYGPDGEMQRAGWGPYEHLPPSEWVSSLGEDYRRCCTSIGWIGQALTLKIMHAETIWDHPAFFDYCDRWMTEDDTESVAEIYRQRGWDYFADWKRQGHTWDDFVNEMWAAYRNDLPVTSGDGEQVGKIDAVDLRLPYPNPFNSSVTVSYYLPRDARIQLSVYLANGQRAATLDEGFRQAGDYSFVWKARGMSSGLYFCLLTAGRQTVTRKIVYIK